MSKGKKPIQLNKSTIKWLKDEAEREAIDKLENIAFAYIASAWIAATRDEKVKDDVISKICTRASRYVDYLDDGKVTFEQAQEINARYGYRLEGDNKQ